VHVKKGVEVGPAAAVEFAAEAAQRAACSHTNSSVWYALQQLQVPREVPTKDISSPGREQAVYNYQQPPAEQRLFWQGFYDDAQGLRYKYEMVKALGLPPMPARSARRRIALTTKKHKHPYHRLVVVLGPDHPFSA
jgi:hypothetical protein